MSNLDTTMEPSKETLNDEPTQEDHLRDLQAALQTNKGHADFLAYHEAPPHLVEQETPAARFLLYENNEAVKAAYRMAAYWKVRKEHFGERAYLPMDLSGEGAMSPEDLEFMRYGFVSVLPNDRNGRTFWVSDSNRFPEGDVPLENQLRVIFYLLHVASEEAINVTEGIAVISHVDEPTFGNCVARSGQIGRILVEAIPVRMSALYIAMHPDRAHIDFFKSAVTSMIKCYRDVVVPVIARSEQELLERFDEIGLDREAVPVSLAGEWTYDAMEDWIKCRFFLESRRRSGEIPFYPRIEPRATRRTSLPKEPKVVEETDAMVEKALASMFECIDLIPYDDKVEYLEAVDLVPYLVEKESDPLLFLRAASFDPWFAARRLIKYWGMRKQIFEDRYLRPMDQTGEGVLSPEDLVNFNAGAVYPIMEESGGGYIHLDRHKLPNEDGYSRVRCVVYALHVASHSFPELKFLSVVRAGNWSRPVFALGLATFFEFVRTAMSARFGGFHRFHIPPSDASESTVNVSSSVTEKLLDSCGEVRIVQSKEDALIAAEALGYHRETLPGSLGGSLDPSYFAKWQSKQLKEEKEAYEVFVKENTEILSRRKSWAIPAERDLPPLTDHFMLKDASIYKSRLSAFVRLQRGVSDEDERRLQELEATLRLIPDEDQINFTRALDNVPHLVMTESPPLLFLRFFGSDSWRAARRLIAYWNSRVNLFGDRAFLPMDLTGDGAMDESDVSVVETGFIGSAPRDNRGRAVLILDRSQFNGKALPSPDTRIRAVFFWLNQLLRYDFTTEGSPGLAVIHVVSDKGFERAPIQRAVALARDIFPIKAEAMFVCCATWRTQKRTFLELLLPLTLRLAQPVVAKGNIFCHITGSPAEMCSRLEHSGFSKQSIPTILGGEWTFSTKDVQSSQADVAPGADAANDKDSEEKASSLPSSLETFFVGSLFDVLPGNTLNERDALCVREMTKAMKRLPVESTQAFREAFDKAPHLVKTESPILKFLVISDHDCDAAARRLALHWQHRVTLFEDKAFLPMNISGNGAMSPVDVELIRTGFVCVVPCQDGTQVVCFDRSRVPTSDKFDNKSKARAAFYILHVASHGKQSQTVGGSVIGIWRRGNDDRSLGLFKWISDFLRLGSGSSLFRARRIHIVGKTAKADTNTFMRSFLPRFNDIFGAEAAAQQIVVHMFSSDRVLVSELKLHGLDMQCIPTSIGGSWSYESFSTWVDQRISFEGQTPVTDTKLQAPTDKYEVAEAGGGQITDAGDDSMEYLDELNRIIETYPQGARQAFDEAMALGPSFILKESDPIIFLRTEDYDVHRAAKRLVSYWTTRREVYGVRSTLPMNQTGEGTLSRDDITCLSAGHVAMLPNDEFGRPVVLLDVSQNDGLDDETMLRVCFYMFSIASESDLAQTSGVVLLSVLHPNLTNSLVSSVFSLVFMSMPIRTLSRHVIQVPGEKSGLIGRFRDALLRFASVGETSKVQVHKGSSVEELAASLIAFGIPAEGLPKSLGGSWSYERFAHWLDFRVRYEWELPAGPSHKESDMPFKYTVKKYCDLSEDQKSERKRRMNVIHSRRKRERQRIEMQVFQGQVTDLRLANVDVAERNKRLEELLSQAKKLIAVEGMSETGAKNIPTRLHTEEYDAVASNADASRGMKRKSWEAPLTHPGLHDLGIRRPSPPQANFGQSPSLLQTANLGHAAAIGQSPCVGRAPSLGLGQPLSLSQSTGIGQTTVPTLPRRTTSQLVRDMLIDQHLTSQIGRQVEVGYSGFRLGDILDVSQRSTMSLGMPGSGLGASINLAMNGSGHRSGAPLYDMSTGSIPGLPSDPLHGFNSVAAAPAGFNATAAPATMQVAGRTTDDLGLQSTGRIVDVGQTGQNPTQHQSYPPQDPRTTSGHSMFNPWQWQR